MTPNKYTAIGSNYAYAELRVGVSLMRKDGKEVYFQPGDMTTHILNDIEDILNHSTLTINDVANSCLDDYFA